MPCLVPVADMFNMAANEDDVNIECKTNDESMHFECYTTKPVSNNSQVTFNEIDFYSGYITFCYMSHTLIFAFASA